MNKETTTKARLFGAFAVVAIGVLLAVGLTACGTSNAGGDASGEDSTTITVAAVPTPHADILNNAVAPLLKEEGYTLEVKEFTDYVQPNTVTEEGDVDANYFQHRPYLDNFNAEKGTHLVAIEPVHFEAFGLYAGKSVSIDAVPEGGVIAVPNDATNEARALLLLQDAGLLTLRDGVGVEATVNDIVDNPKNIQFKELEAATIPNVLQDVDLACINANYAIAAGLSTSDALDVEKADSEAAQTYANLLVVKEGNEDTDKTKALAKALNSNEVRDYINANFGGAVVPVF